MTKYAFFSAIEHVCVPKPTRQASIFTELNFRHKNTRDVTFEKLDSFTDKNDRWSAKLIVYRQK